MNKVTLTDKTSKMVLSWDEFLELKPFIVGRTITDISDVQCPEDEDSGFYDFFVITLDDKTEIEFRNDWDLHTFIGAIVR